MGLLRRSEHDCCSGPDYDEHQKRSIDAPKPRVAGCEWNYDLFKELNGYKDYGYLLPVEDDGPSLKLGTALGRW